MALFFGGWARRGAWRVPSPVTVTVEKTGRFAPRVAFWSAESTFAPPPVEAAEGGGRAWRWIGGCGVAGGEGLWRGVLGLAARRALAGPSPVTATGRTGRFPSGLTFFWSAEFQPSPARRGGGRKAVVGRGGFGGCGVAGARGFGAVFLGLRRVGRCGFRRL